MNKEQVFDELLVLKSQGGDSKAFGLLIKRWNKKLISFAHKFVRDQDAAKDIAQESWIAAYNNLHSLREIQKFKTWIYRLTYNKSMDFIRKNNRQIESFELNSEDEVNDGKWETVEHLLEHLPVQQKVILSLFYLEEQSIKQISEILNMPEGTVKSRIFYAREKLKKLYKEVTHEN